VSTGRPTLTRIRGGTALCAARAATKRELLSEAIGTGLIVLLGTGCVSAAKFTGSHSGLWQLAASWGASVSAAIYLTGGVSGAHLNPAVTGFKVLLEGFPLRKAMGYIAAQLFGAIGGSLAVLGSFAPAIARFEAENGIIRGTAASFASAPGCMTFAAGYTPLAAAMSEALQTAILIACALSFGHKKSAVPEAAQPAMVGVTLAALISCFGPLTCTGLNPARDLGPRIVAFFGGWGATAFQHCWAYVVGPIVGALVGAGVHSALYGGHDEAEEH